MRLALALVAMLCSSALFCQADPKLNFRLQCEGRVSDLQRKAVGGVKVSVSLDELWGMKDETARRAQEKKRGKFPAGTVSGSGMTNESGAFDFIATIELRDGTLPKTKIKDASGKEVETAWVSILLVGEKAGYVTQSWHTVLYQSLPNNKLSMPNFDKCASLRGRAVNKDKSAGLASVALFLIKPSDYPNREALLNVPKTITDGGGTFKFENLNAQNTNGCVVAVESESWVLDPLSKLWSGGLNFSTTDLDLGDVSFWPAGGMKAAFVRADKSPVSVALKLTPLEPANAGLLESSRPSASSHHFKSLPGGKYSLQADGGEGLCTSRTFEVKPGQTTDLGTETLIQQEQTVELKVKLIGKASDEQGRPLEGVKVTATPNSLWGHPTQRDADRHAKVHGDYPKVTVTGDATSEDDGGFIIELTITLKGKNIPKIAAGARRGRGGDAAGEVPYCHLDFGGTKSGYVAWQSTTMIYEGATNHLAVRLAKSLSVKGRALEKSKRAPLANLTIYFGNVYNFANPDPRRPVKSVKTNDKGEFVFNDVSLSEIGSSVIFTDSETWALDPLSPLWQGTRTREASDVDFGDVPFVAAGGLKISFVNAQGTNLAVQINLSLNEPRGGRFLLGNPAAGAGSYHYKYLPEGSYALSAYSENNAPFAKIVKIKGGETLDLGKITLIPPVNLLVKAQGPDGKAVPRSNVRAEYLSGDLPEHFGRQRDPATGKTYLYESDYGGQGVTFPGIPQGKYRVTVTAENFCPTSMEVEIGAESKTVTVTMSAGANVLCKCFEVDGNQADGNIYLIGTETDAYAKYKSSGSLKDVLNEREYGNAPGVYRGYSSRHDKSGIRCIAPGKYLTVAIINYRSPLIGAEIELKEGETRELVFKIEAASLKVTLSNGGKAVADTKILLMHVSQLAALQDPGAAKDSNPMRGMRYQNKEATTDKKGMALFSGLEAGTFCVLTAREYLALTAAGANTDAELVKALKARIITLKPGENTQKIDLPTLSGTWLTVEIRSDGNSFENAVLCQLPYTGTAYSGRTDNGYSGRSFEFGLVSKGSYEFSARSFGSTMVIRRIEVTKSGEQTVTIDAYLRKVTIAVTPAKGDNSPVNVYLRPISEIETPGVGNNGTGARMTEAGKYETAVPQGKCLVVAVSSAPGAITRVVSKEVDVGKSGADVKLKLPDNVGGIRLKPMSSKRTNMQMAVRARVFDSKGKEIALAEPSMAWFMSNTSDPIIPSLAPGTYSVELSVGVDPVRLDNITVVANELEEVEVNFSHVRMASCIVKADGLSKALLLKAAITAHDASGQTLPIQKPVGALGYAYVNEMGGEFMVNIQSLPSETAEVRIKVPGYKEAKFTLDNSGSSARVNLEKE